MGNFAINFIANHTVMSVWIIGGFVMTLMAYIVPDFTRDYMVQDEVFTPGFFFGTFTHMNWLHYFGNLIIFIPAGLLVSKWYGQLAVLAVAVGSTVLTGLISLIFKQCGCGMSGIATALAGMACIYGTNIFGIGFLVCLLVVEVITSIKGDGVSHIAHFIGYIGGALVGYLIQAI